mmetsp:Transcript_31992/g.51664  ORF Transcript_31992/g.51664 Transcript_31992/m.51664 type:complete len:357 (-) Transcript_31992:105-1175(-)
MARFYYSFLATAPVAHASRAVSLSALGICRSTSVRRGFPQSSRQSFRIARYTFEVSCSATLIDGKKIAGEIQDELKTKVDSLIKAGMKRPGLAVVLVGDRKDSATYVRSKKKACAETGIESIGVDLPGDSTEEQVLKAVTDLNSNPEVHGILVQLPLPSHIRSETVLSAISIEKDVDGFHPVNVGRLCSTGRAKPLAVACTPLGCIALLERSGVPIKGKRAVVLGRSSVVGLPAALLLLQKDATVTVCHSKTEDLPSVVREADILIAAVGRPQMVKGSWVKPGAVVIDVGINAIDDASSPRGYRLVGDVDFNEVSQVASMITPVPGGVGPMTIAMLMSNTVACAMRIENFESSPES